MASHILPGDFVKVRIQSLRDVERIWVIVDAVDDDGFRGRLNNEPVSDDYAEGDPFSGTFETIIDHIPGGEG